ncbi:MAG TPA: hypothetical protein VMZ49_11915 [Patescibacteria group bacterium]|nr:hypothetical protein [Patescibacteria group bacterium]
MSSLSIKLYRLRGIFVVYFVLKSVAGAIVAALVLKPFPGGQLGRFGWRGFPTGSLMLFSLLVAAAVLVIAWLIFGQLLLRKNWARVLLLVIAWLTVLSAVFSLLASTQIGTISSWVSHWLPDLDWQKLMNFDRVQKVFELLFWGYLISVLQFDTVVRNEFFPHPPTGDAGK